MTKMTGWQNYVTESDEKPCCKCGLRKSLIEFQNSSSKKDGKQTFCRSCMKILRAERHKKSYVSSEQDGRKLRKGINGKIKNIIVNGVSKRLCSICDNYKILDEYYSHPRPSSYCNDCKSIKGKNYYIESRERQRNRYYLTRYKITLEEYNELLETQDGKCAICKQEQTNGKNLAIDHDAVTGKVRGILCDVCNRGLGYFKDQPDVMRVGAEYLERNQDD